MLVVAMAPGFTKAFISWPLYCSMALIELNTCPVASTPTPFSIALSPLSCITSRHGEDLRDRLDREQLLDVADRVDLAVDGDQRDAEQVRRHLGEGGDVVGVLAFLQSLVLGMRRLQRRVDGGLGGSPLRHGRRRDRRASSSSVASVREVRIRTCVGALAHSRSASARAVGLEQRVGDADLGAEDVSRRAVLLLVVAVEPLDADAEPFAHLPDEVEAGVLGLVVRGRSLRGVAVDFDVAVRGGRAPVGQPAMGVADEGAEVGQRLEVAIGVVRCVGVVEAGVVAVAADALAVGELGAEQILDVGASTAA